MLLRKLVASPEPSSQFHPGALHPISPWDFSAIEQDISRRARSLHEFEGTRTNIDTSARRIDDPTTYSRRNSKAIIKVSPIPLEPWPGATLSGNQSTPAISRPVEAQGAGSSIIAPSCSGRADLPIQAFSTGTDFLPAPAEGASLDYQVDRNLATSRRRCTSAEFDADRSCHLCYEMRPVVNTHEAAQRPTEHAPAELLNEDGHIVKPRPFHATRSPSEGRDSRGGERVFRSPEGDSNNGTNPLPHQAQRRTSTVAPLPSTLADGLPPPGSIPSHHTPSSIRHRDAADAFLGITHRTTRELDDSLERGIIGNQLEAETGLTPWLNFNALGPRTKAVIVVVILVIVLLGAVVKLIQVIQAPTSTN